jgi:hypothetical protein
MTHPLQPHFDHVAAILRELRSALDDDPAFRSSRNVFDEYLEANELELALHSACGALLAAQHSKPDGVVLRMIENAHQAMSLHDECVQRLSLL